MTEPLPETQNKPPKHRRNAIPLIQLLPNLITVAAICAGLSAIRFAVQGDFQLAVQLIFVAAVLDFLDGRLARLLKSESALGAELDSLADFLNFGVAPGLLMYFWAFNDMRNLGWIAVIVYVLCCVLRLARFNTVANDGDLPKRHFIGVPSPAGAVLALLPVFVSFIWQSRPLIPDPLIAIYLIGIGLLMISNIQTASLKAVTIYRESIGYLFIGFICVIAMLLSFPWLTLALIDLGYLAAILCWWARSQSRTTRQDT